MAAKSYAWAQTLYAAVAPGSDAEVNTPGFESPENYKTSEAQAVHNGAVLTAEQATIAFDTDWTHAHVTNNTEAEWLPGDTIYLAVAGIPFDPSNVEESFSALEARVIANEAAIAALDTRVTALETPATQAHAEAPTAQVAQ